MNRPAWLFAATTLLFAGVSVYLALELREERAASAAAPAPLQADAARNTHTPIVVTQVTTPAPSAPGAPPATAAASFSGADLVFVDGAVVTADAVEARRKYLAREKRFLEDMADPEKRARLLEQAKGSVRSPYPGLSRHLGLTDGEADRLFELMAEQQLQSHERQAQCTTSPDCNYRGFTSNEGDIQQRQLADLLGPERQRKFAQYQESMSERQTVSALRSSLPDRAFLNEQRAEELVGALYEERSRYQQEVMSRNGGFNSYGTGAGMLYVGDSGTVEERVAAARDYSNRLRDRAAQVLTPEQAKGFNQMQDELIANVETILHEQETQKDVPGPD